jgi:hypothetical protein
LKEAGGCNHDQGETRTGENQLSNGKPLVRKQPKSLENGLSVNLRYKEGNEPDLHQVHNSLHQNLLHSRKGPDFQSGLKESKDEEKRSGQKEDCTNEERHESGKIQRPPLEARLLVTRDAFH